MQRAPEDRLKRGHQQREVNHKGSEKGGEVNLVLSSFLLRKGLEKFKLFFFFYQSSFDISLSL